MSEIPSFFNKMDFFRILLPGYVAVTLFLGLFAPDLILKREQNVQADLFSIVLLLVAGPVVGGVLRAVHRFFYSIYYSIPRKASTKRIRQKKMLDYARIRTFCEEKQLNELDQIDSEYDFRVSTALALSSIGIYYLLVNSISNVNDLILSVTMFFIAAGLFYGGYIVYIDRWMPLFEILNHEVAKLKKCEYVYDQDEGKYKFV